ncbi:MAG: RDD family protein [Chloroflexota bacterium]|nr:RDD family protein [Chloroflexota bacterium]
MGRFEPLPTDPYRQPSDLFGAICAACRQDTRLGVKFCTACNVLRSDAEYGHSPRYAATRLSRFMGALADGLIPSVIGLALGLASLGGVLELELWLGSVIWLIWFAFLARRGQTPGKQLVSTQVIRTDGSSATRARMWAREVGYRVVINAPILILSSLYPDSIASNLIVLAIGVIVVADGVAIFFNPDRQTLHDRVFGTLVINIRAVPQTSAELRAL